MCMFLYCSGGHRDLHSFPTRRSSDLSASACGGMALGSFFGLGWGIGASVLPPAASIAARAPRSRRPDRKSTRLNSSHLGISYAVFCLKKKTKQVKSVRHHTIYADNYQ